jgi:hypothetical protein
MNDLEDVPSYLRRSMVRDKNRRVGARALTKATFGIVLLAALCPTPSASAQPTREILGLEIAIVPSEVVIKPYGTPRLSLSFKNTGSEAVTIVRPVWGCENGGKRVRYTWSLSDEAGEPIPQEGWFHPTGVANITSVDCVTISPGQCYELKADFNLCRPTEARYLVKGGSYEALLTYCFDPTDDEARESYRREVKRLRPQMVLYEDDAEVQGLLKRVAVGTKTSKPLKIVVK